jgi:hypothetical protein
METKGTERGLRYNVRNGARQAGPALCRSSGLLCVASVASVAVRRGPSRSFSLLGSQRTGRGQQGEGQGSTRWIYQVATLVAHCAPY